MKRLTGTVLAVAGRVWYCSSPSSGTHCLVSWDKALTLCGGFEDQLRQTAVKNCKMQDKYRT